MSIFAKASQASGEKLSGALTFLSAVLILATLAAAV